MTSTVTPPSPQQQADQAIEQILHAQVRGKPLSLVVSPPGAGKTGLVERVAAFEAAYNHGRSAVATETNAQACDVARRMRAGFPKLRVTLFVREDYPVPSWVLAIPGLILARKSGQIPPGAGIVIANAARWSWMDRTVVQPFTQLIVDEAYQLPDYGFAQIAALARRILLVGDPGQIDPIVKCDIERWACEPDGPHVACPTALVARKGDAVWCKDLPVSRRLVPDTVAFVQPAFYPDLSFTSLCPPGGRALLTAGSGASALDHAITRACGGQSIVQLEAPASRTDEYDERLAQAMVDLIDRLFARGASVRDGTMVTPLTPDRVGVVCAHVSQVAAVRERLPASRSAILVESANRYQGLERAIMLVHHPLSGRADADKFHLDAGRLCVSLSRHRVACFIFARAGIEEMLLRYAPSGERVLGVADDPEFEGGLAHLSILRALRTQGRIVPM
jgi:AAA domain